MPIFSDGSTFPIYKFNLLDNRHLESFEDIENFVFTDLPNSNKKFEDLLIDALKKYEKQHLFEILTIYALKAIFNKNHREITKFDNINSTSITNIRFLLPILNMRIDLNYIEAQLDMLSDNEYVKVNKSVLISSLINFTYKFVFVKFANLIYCNVEDDIQDTMSFEHYNDIYLKYQNLIMTKKYNSLNYHQMKSFLNNYKKSFKTEDDIEIEKINNEILLYADWKESEKILNQIIERNIVIDEKLSSNKKNKILIPFYKSIICVFFYPKNKDFKIDDAKLVEYFKKFRLRIKN